MRGRIIQTNYLNEANYEHGEAWIYSSLKQAFLVSREMPFYFSVGLQAGYSINVFFLARAQLDFVTLS